MSAWTLLATLSLVILLLGPPAAAAPVRYVPHPGDSFAYTETITLTNGTGNYTGYTEAALYNGSISVTATAPNGTESATYQSAGMWQNNQGQSQHWSEGGSFTFSATTFHYVQGTDNQTGYVNPYVWFYTNNTLPVGSPFYALNTPMTVVSRNTTVGAPASSTGYATSIRTEGNGSYQRNDVYGVFAASYQWTEYFDPATGYVLAYVYVEHDADAAGDGFTWTDVLRDTHTSFPVLSTQPPPTVGGGSTGSSTSFLGGALVAFAVLLAIVIVALVVGVVVIRARRARSDGLRSGLPRHADSSVPPPMPAPPYTPPPLNLFPADQPKIQQIVMRETVKVPCRFCGTLIDSTATSCPKCGAPRT